MPTYFPLQKKKEEEFSLLKLYFNFFNINLNKSISNSGFCLFFYFLLHLCSIIIFNLQYNKKYLIDCVLF